MTRSRATWIGLLAILAWSTIVGLIRSVSESFGAVLGAACIYTLAACWLRLSLGPIRLQRFSRVYLYWGSGLFVAYELCLALSIGYADDARQAIEVGMVNYLWPALTMMAAILFNRQRASWLVWPGFVTAIVGVCWVLGGNQGLDLSGMLDNVRSNPLSYGLAFVGALIWAAYCTVTTRLAHGQNGVTLFFILVALALWGQALFVTLPPVQIDLAALVTLLLASLAMGLGYAAWNIGILHGNVTLLAGASYFIPVLSAGLAALLLRSALPWSFWQGAALVCIGSLLCWWSTRRL